MRPSIVVDAPAGAQFCNGGICLMKRLLMVSLVGTLAACQPEPAAEPVAEEAAEAAPVTVANGTPVGTLAVTYADGTEGTAIFNADGTYSDTDADRRSEEHTHELKSLMRNSYAVL